jgi:hypothetical protein
MGTESRCGVIATLRLDLANTCSILDRIASALSAEIHLLLTFDTPPPFCPQSQLFHPDQLRAQHSNIAAGERFHRKSSARDSRL